MVATVDDVLSPPVARLLRCILGGAHAYTRGEPADVAAVWAAAEGAVRACGGACPRGEPGARPLLCACALVRELEALHTERSFALLHALNGASLARLFGGGVHDFTPPVEFVVARRMHASLMSPAMFHFTHALALALRALLVGARRALLSLQRQPACRADARRALCAVCTRAMTLVMTPDVQRAMAARRRAHDAALQLATGGEPGAGPLLEGGPAASMNSPRAAAGGRARARAPSFRAAI